jgi:hypothetical protein
MMVMWKEPSMQFMIIEKNKNILSKAESVIALCS